MPRSTSRCPKCARKIKYLFECKSEHTISKAGKTMVKNRWVKRALYCVICDEVYSLNLEHHQKSIRQKAVEDGQDLYDVHKIV